MIESTNRRLSLSDGGSSLSPSCPPVSTSRPGSSPSDPRTSRGAFEPLDASEDRSLRVQRLVLLVLGIALVAIPLYLWRRPRAESAAIPVSTDAGVELATNAAVATAQEGKPNLGAARNLLCQDPGPRKTDPSDCDHVVDLEKALSRAIEESADCVPKGTSGTLTYVADVSFKRKTVRIGMPRDGRSVKGAGIVSACQAQVKDKLLALPLDAMTHAHSRYKIAIAATYVNSAK